MQPARDLAFTLRRTWQDEIVSLLWHFTLAPVIRSCPPGFLDLTPGIRHHNVLVNWILQVRKMSGNFGTMRRLWLAILLTATALAWAIVSASIDVSCSSTESWFPRSGAIMVIVAIVIGLKLRPALEDDSAPDLVGIFESTLNDRPIPSDHWANRYLADIGRIEIALAIAGTAIWSYGDLWLSCTNY